MKIKFLVDTFKKGYGNNTEDYWEDAETIGNETPMQCAERIVKFFNDTLRPGETPRKVVEAKEVTNEESNYVKQHDWAKTNLFTKIKRHISWDEYVCLNCNATGKIYHLGGDVVLDYKSRGKKICK